MGLLAGSSNGHGLQRLSINSRTAPPALGSCDNKKPCLYVFDYTNIASFSFAVLSL
jgi:hypothetical protein